VADITDQKVTNPADPDAATQADAQQRARDAVGLQPPSEPLVGLPKPNESGPAAAALKSFLAANGFPAGEGDTFDAAAQAALVQFQIEHSESGDLGPNTLRFINDLLRRSSKSCSVSFFGLKPPVRPITRTLARGDAHADVQVLQRFLNDNGFLLAARGAGAPGAETENFQARTAVALARFQTAYGLLSEKGALGPKNLFFLEGLSENPSVFECPKLVPPSAPFVRDLKQGDRGTDVKVLQKFLNDNNQLLATQQYGSRGAETTYFGSLTRASLGRFQKAYGLGKMDGVFDAATRAFVNATPRP
jgi:peptidoglycan hydrolase-like protein with peptidoglycan-binding domain